MHPLQFSLKRAHHRALGLARGMLLPFHITPARLDMLQAIAAAVPEPPTQNELARMLGVTRQTVSEMLDALEALELVTRTPGELRGRYCHFIKLTEGARALLARVFAVLIRSGVAGKAAARMLKDLPKAPTKGPALLKLTDELRNWLEDPAFFTPPAVARSRIDSGKPLEGEERRLFLEVCSYCRTRFTRLPAMYIIMT
jgi:DNA-binding MarR family transcriptional regulator